MSHKNRNWALGVLLSAAVLLGGCAGFVRAVDPCFFYRAPGDAEVYFNERYQAAGLAKNIPADTVLLGTSMTANYRAGHVAETFGSAAVKLTLPDGYLSEFDRVMDVVWRYHNPRRVVLGLDINILIRDESEKTAVMPAYLYNTNPLDDAKYLLNKDTLYYSAYALLTRSRGGGEALDEAFTWDKGIWWNHQTALENYTRPEQAAQTVAADAYLNNAKANLAVIEGWAAAHPDTEFDVFFPPYSILYWDKTARQGELDAVFGALELAARTLTQSENIRVWFLPAATELTENLDNYCDYIHHSGAAADQALALMKAGEWELNAENFEKTLADWREFVVHYDYEKFWDESFWVQWNKTHAA